MTKSFASGIVAIAGRNGWNNSLSGLAPCEPQNPDLIRDRTDRRHATDRSVIGSLDRDHDPVVKLDFIRSPANDHRFQNGD